MGINKDSSSNRINPVNRRAPPAVRLPNSAMGGGVHWCPHDGYRMVYERVNVNNYICPGCSYELERGSSSGGGDIANSQPSSTISTIDGWVDVGLANTNTKTAKFRPVEGHRKDAVTQARFHPMLHPETRKMMDRGLTITSSESVINSDVDMLDTAAAATKKPYSNKVRRKQYY